MVYFIGNLHAYFTLKVEYGKKGKKGEKINNKCKSNIERNYSGYV